MQKQGHHDILVLKHVENSSNINFTLYLNKENRAEKAITWIHTMTIKKENKCSSYMNLHVQFFFLYQTKKSQHHLWMDSELNFRSLLQFINSFCIKISYYTHMKGIIHNFLGLYNILFPITFFYNNHWN